MGSEKDGDIIIGVIGGAGQMGAWLQHFWQRHGKKVVWSDCGTGLANADVVKSADITFVAVPLHVTSEVIRSIAPLVSEQHCLVSIASLMQPSVQALNAVLGEALCVHPVFGPTVLHTEGLPVVVAKVKGNRWCEWLVDVFRSDGMQVKEASPAEHDASMAVVQALLHSMFVALCGAMTSAGLSPELALDWASPTMRLQLGLAARILGQDPELYADLVLGNSLAPAVLDGLAEELQRLASFARADDRDGFVDAFVKARSSFGDSNTELARRAEAALEHFA